MVWRGREYNNGAPHEAYSSRIPESAVRLGVREFWSGDLGLTLVSISLTIFILVILPLHEAGLPGRFFFDLIIVTLLVCGALIVSQSRVAKILTIFIVFAGAAMLWSARFHPTPLFQQLSSTLLVLTLLVYVRIVSLVMFCHGPVTWSRIQGGVSAYLLLGLAWASAYQLIEKPHSGSFRFGAAPTDIDQLTAKLSYFSFATLSTVGFGDVVSVNPFARSLPIAEASVEQLFPAILIGALVAMAMQSRPKC